VHGPADLDIAVVTSHDRLHVWEWVKWLPHVAVADGPQLLSAESDIAQWARAHTSAGADPSRWAAMRAVGHLTMIVVDEPAWWHDRASPLRELLSDDDAPVRFVVLGASPEEVPAVCTTVLEERPSGGASLQRFLENSRLEGVHPFLADHRIATDVARRLASFDDPELPMTATSALPRELPLASLMGLDRADTGTISAHWHATRRGPSLSTPIGRVTDGPVDLVLDAGGLELLVIGAPDAATGTGSLLEGAIVGLAVNHQPDDVNVLAFDLSGRDTFATCAGLPHVVDVIVDPSTTIMHRALRCLRAEASRREAALGAHDAGSWAEYVARAEPPDVIPRLVIVLDEVAPPEADRAEFVVSLLDIIETGQRYGMHVICATRRPGAVDRTILAAARQTLSVLPETSPGEGLEAPWASGLPGSRISQEPTAAPPDGLPAVLPTFVPGRAVLRRGDRSSYLQTVTSVGPHLGAHSPRAVTAFVIGREPTPMERRLARANAAGPDRADDPELVRVVSAVAGAAAGLGQEQQRSPIPAPLPQHLALADLLERFPGDGVPFALEDLPDEQRQPPRWWQPGPVGGLAIYGGSADERTDVLTALAIGIATRAAADDVHLYVIGDREHPAIAALAALPHTGAVVGFGERARIEALVQHLDDEITRRADLADRGGGSVRVAASEPAVALMVDDLGHFRQQLRRLDDGDGILLDLERAIRDGAQYGICAVLTADAPRLVPLNLSTSLDKIVLPLDDPAELAVFGLSRADVTAEVRGRALRPAARSELQLAAPPNDIALAITELRAERAADRPPHMIPELQP
jgi:S-DNA-T family DNA segregation ATPase FtsK/SpoIIIE